MFICKTSKRMGVGRNDRTPVAGDEATPLRPVAVAAFSLVLACCCPPPVGQSHPHHQPATPLRACSGQATLAAAATKPPPPRFSLGPADKGLGCWLRQRRYESPAASDECDPIFIRDKVGGESERGVQQPRRASISEQTTSVHAKSISHRCLDSDAKVAASGLHAVSCEC